MPPKRSAKTTQSSGAALRAAASFESPMRLELPKTRKENPTAKQTEAMWKGAVIEIGKAWYQFARVQWKKTSPMDSIVEFSDDGKATAPKARLALKVLMDETTRANACTTIILGALGGTFKSKEGLVVKLKSLQHDAGGKIAGVQYALLDDEGVELMEEAPVAISKFAAEFGEALVVGTGADEDDKFDFAPFPNLVKAMRVTGILSGSGTSTPVSTAVQFLTGLRARDEVDPSELSNVAAAADAAAEQEKASPALSRLKRAATGALGSQPPAKQGKIVRALALQMSQVDDLPAPKPAGGGASKKGKSKPPAKTSKKRSASEAFGGDGDDDEEDDSDSGDSDDEEDEV